MWWPWSGVREQDDALVAHPRQIEIRADAAAQRRHQVRQLFVFEHLRQRQPLGVQHLAAQRQDRLGVAIAALLGRAARGLAFTMNSSVLSRLFERQSASLLAG